jgi:hypothetical protein
MENSTPMQDSEEETCGSPLANSKRPAPLLKDATKCTRKKSKSEHVHLPSNDVRSNYHLIFETIFNGCQKSVATKHFKNICTEDCALVSRSVNNPFGPNYREIRGIESMVEYVDTALEAIPDCIFKITDSKFFRKPQNESVIIASYTTNGRMIYTLDTLNSEDVEDIDSAISGLQMLYQVQFALSPLFICAFCGRLVTFPAASRRDFSSVANSLTRHFCSGLLRQRRHRSRRAAGLPAGRKRRVQDRTVLLP